MKYILSIIVIFISLVACNNHSANWVTLNEIESHISESPSEALEMLKEIDCDTLSESDRNYYHFLTVKAMDKGYIVHTSDSLILLAHDYYSNHENDRYPEVVYYCGRVYSNLGDFPTALNYFQNALDLLSNNTENIKLRGTVLSQTGRLLNNLRLYEEAAQHLEESIKIDSTLCDSINQMFDLQLLGAIHLHAKNYSVAENKFKQARMLAESVNPNNVAMQDVYLAAIKLYTGDLDSAIIKIRPTISNLNAIDKYTGLAYAAHIYLKSGILDTAFIYANNLIETNNSYNKATGYQTLLSPKLRDYIPEDSLHRIVTEYRLLLENSLNKNESQAALIQNSYYNYHKHERERIKAEAENATLLMWVMVVTLLAFCLILIVLYLKYRNKSQRLKLQEAINNIQVLRRIIAESESQANNRTDSNISNEFSDSNIETLQAKLKEELLSVKTEISPEKVTATILNSEVYDYIQQCLIKNKIIPEKSEVWIKLNELVNSCYPNLKYRLRLLSGGKLKEVDFHLALLIKCGLSPSQIAIIMGRTKGAITYRRDKLGVKLFGEKLGAQFIDDVIRRL